MRKWQKIQKLSWKKRLIKEKTQGGAICPAFALFTIKRKKESFWKTQKFVHY
ncbi:hypothetical protein FM120_27960 [Sphingobacterium faecium PCAi_F2.5]|nr:hypothetical protein FM120_27960 [Sphingobacterium faecium PCAi_F2.5]